MDHKFRGSGTRQQRCPGGHQGTLNLGDEAGSGSGAGGRLIMVTSPQPKDKQYFAVLCLQQSA